MSDIVFEQQHIGSETEQRAPSSGLGSRISTKLVLSAAVMTVLVFAGLLVAIYIIVSMVAEREDQRAALLRAMNQDLRAQVMTLQQSYFEIPKRLEVNPSAELKNWAVENGAAETVHSGRDAIVARYKKRRQRRDLQKAANFIVEDVDGGAAISFGAFDGGEYADAVTELTIPGVTADAANQKIADLFNTASLEQRLAIVKGELVDEALAAEQVRNAIVQENEKILAKESELSVFESQARALLAILAGVGTLLAIAAAYASSRIIVTRPLERVTQAIRAVASMEQVTVPYLERKDEIGTIARRVGQFQSVLKENALLQERTSAAHNAQAEEVDRREQILKSFEKEIGLILTEVAGATQRMEDVTRTMKDSVSGAAGSAEKARSASITAAAGAGGVSEAAASLDRSISDLGLVIRAAAESSALASQRAESTTATVGQLTTLAGEVGGFADIISTVAHQTNLLAMNATIEAARAGEMGRGFAVVAGEVKSLAGQTEDAALQISRQVTEMRSVIDAAVSAIGEAIESVASIDRNTQDAVSAMTAQTEATREIASSADGAAAASNEVNSGIASLAEATVRSEDAAREVDATADAMSALSRRLRMLSSSFFQDIRVAPAE
ncbi:methyl-accepting chemotaxis protein [Nisaea denitrificans]|uniref:methyl-accepting chemotaxis protein n=1 Tax=Nisaea denitrificans TaxID=390877 RepID=UPI0003F9A7D2|nr:methyl-accepting chemotaxis protein [Nisaea denitrificans]